MIKRLRDDWFRSRALNEKFCTAIGSEIISVSSLDKKPIEITLKTLSPYKFRVYIFNCCNPPGGRPMNEYKIVLNVGQSPGSRSNFDSSGGFLPIVVGYVKNLEIFVIWDAAKHKNFAYNANMQVKADTIFRALSESVSKQYRKTSMGEEVVFACRSQNLGEALSLRIRSLIDDLVRGNYES